MKVVGHGNQAVYVYHYKAYETADTYYYPCKIGMTRTNVLDRIHDQVKTSSPEIPVIDLVVLCNNSKNLERALHAILILHERKIESATGSEWFDTTGDEVLTLCQMLNMC